MGDLQAFNTMLGASGRGDYATVRSLAPAVLQQLANEPRYHALLPNAHGIYAQALVADEQLLAATEHYEWALFGPLNHELTRNRAVMTVNLANSYWKLGRYQALVAAVRPLLEGHGTPETTSAALRMLSSITWRTTGDLDAATKLLEQAAVEAGTATGQGLWWRDAVYRGQYLMELNRLDEAEAVLRHGVDREREELERTGRQLTSARANLSMFIGALSRVEIRVGRLDVARALHEEAAVLLPPDRKYGSFAWHLCASELAAAERDWVPAERHADACIDITSNLDARPSMAVAWKVRARIARDRDQVPSARAWFALALQEYEQLGHPRDIAEMQLELSAL